MRARRAWTGWLRLAVGVLSLLVAVGGSLPWLARWVSGPSTHVCHCETGAGHAHCSCPICFPDLDDGSEHLASEVKGKCGDDDTGWRTLSQPAVFAVGAIVLPCAHERVTVTRQHDVPSRALAPPDPPPPRSLRVS
jgi:disulfide bond formation protein DsbB